MSFSLFRRPGSVAFLDDDADYLDMLALVMPQAWHVKLFVHPSACIQSLKAEMPFWDADAWTQQEMVSQWRDGRPLIPQVLDYWSRASERHAFTRVCVVDYSMPAMDGMQALGQLVDWPGARVLLTGQADEQIAVSAFNQGLIDQFIPKQANDISRRLVGAVSQLLRVSHARHAQTWRATLQPHQDALLRVPAVERALDDLASRVWAEYVVIGQPFGVLGMSAAGQATWLQLELPGTLASLAELAELQGVPAADVARIRRGEALADVELGQSLGRDGPPVVRDSEWLGDPGTVLATLFDIPASHAPDPHCGYQSWLSRQPRRTLHS
ncbi:MULTISPECIES: response regulator [Ramlibacter]|uniref:Response regulator n=1 Tax=Ramlibacter aquaticus TaxID=2780094 RepID=A0ABR9SJF6_9BURK|nr:MULTISPECIES: response regulator [Ramlibacter]MBE7942438.1 response regulator [Ramlibacter aquaticus]